MRPVSPVDPKPRKPWDRSGFWPTIGACLVIIGEGMKNGAPWFDMVAGCLIVVGTFLASSQRNKYGAP